MLSANIINISAPISKNEIYNIIYFFLNVYKFGFYFY